MTKITIRFAKLPIEQIKTSLQLHIAPLLKRMPDVRLRRIAERILLGILSGQSPIVTCMARQSSEDEGETWAAAKKISRWLENERFDSRDLFNGLYEIGQGRQKSRRRTWSWRLPRSTSRNRMSAW